MSSTLSAGGTNLRELLRSMAPELHDGEYVIASVNPGRFATLDIASIACFFRESKDEITVIMSTHAAKAADLPELPTFAWITLTVHSSLEAVGLTAAFATALGSANISCNVVAAYYHDHIFVSSRDGAKAMQVLHDLAISHSM